MLPLPPDPLRTAIWHALTSIHRPLAVTHGQARRYPAEVASFAAVAHNTPDALDDLVPLLSPGETVHLLGDRPPHHPHLRYDGVVPCLQLALPPDSRSPPLPLPPVSQIIEPLTCDHAAEMLALIAVAFPGYFRAQTCRMGRYWGIRDRADRTLLAMGGERLLLHPPGQPVWREISGLCVHPTRAAGQGLGTAICTHILAVHRAEGSQSWLHVAQDNTRAVALYHRLGFATLRRIDIHRLRCPGPLPAGASIA